MIRSHLSKSRLMSVRQCSKRLHLEVHRPELAVVSAQTEGAFRIGHRVGDVAREIYGDGSGVTVSLDDGLEAACRATAELVRGGPTQPVFEATFEYAGVFVRVDALLPDGEGWRIVEVKASTELKDEHVTDCAIQAWVVTRAWLPPTRIALAHVDRTFVYAGDGDYRGLLVEEDVTADVEPLLPLVPDWAANARQVIDGPEPVPPVGEYCFDPWCCPFVDHCWPSDTPHPVQDLGGRKARLAEFVAAGWRDVRDVPEDRLTERQQRIQRITRSGTFELLPDAAREIAALEFPRHYIDFETISLPVPIWAGTRPYEALPFQWSCHYEPSPGALAHADFLDLTGEPPMRRFAESLIRALGIHGPVLVYTPYERTVITRLAERFPDLAPALVAIIRRLTDLKPLAEQSFYHPMMRGSWSLKALLPLIAADLRYSDLEEIQDGMGASEGYFEAVNAATPPERKRALERGLRAYCRLDTQALVRLTRFLAGATAT